MPNLSNNDVLVLKEGPERLGYFFWRAAIGMCVLVFAIIRLPVIDYGKFYGSVAGAALLGFCGFVLKIRRVTADPVGREMTLISKGFRQSSIGRIKFDGIKNVQVLMVPGIYTNSNDRGIPVKIGGLHLS
jgi:hypothetical protein